MARLFTTMRLVLSAAWLVFSVAAGPVEVKLLKTPDDGIQPQALVDTNGVLHLIYFKGNASHGDVFYIRQAPGSDQFSQPLQVNSKPGSVLAVGSVRGAQLALGKNGRPHVAWMGNDQATPVILGGQRRSPMEYTRLNDAGTAFEPERNVLTWAYGLDGGGSVAADSKGNVYVAWHGTGPNDQKGEAGRGVFIAHSVNEGKTFAKETQANPPMTGACGCCGMRVMATDDGKIYLLYRAAIEGVDRDMILLAGGGKSKSYQSMVLSPWNLKVCPMSTTFLAASASNVLAAWENQEQVGFSMVDPAAKLTKSITPSGFGKRKHPALAQNRNGDIVLAWTEDTGWMKGGTFAWQTFDKEGKPLGGLTNGDGVPVWGLVAVVAKPTGEFVLIY